MRVVYGRPENEAVAFFRFLRQCVRRVVKNTFARFTATPAGDTIGKRLIADKKEFRLDPLFVERAGDFAERNARATIFARTSVYK